MRDTTSGYHLFLEPEGTLHDILSGYIQTLAHTYDGPAFPPHVTLLGSIPAQSDADVIAKATAIAKECAPLHLALGDLDGEDTYFRAFYFRVEASEPLRDCHERAVALFGMSIEDYRPHLSLYYGMSSAATRAAMATSLTHPGDMTMLVTSLSVYRGEGRAEEWEKIAQIPLGQGR